LTGVLDGTAARLGAAYEKNEFHPGDVLKEGKSIGRRVALGAERGRFAFRGLRISRDLYWLARGAHGVDSPQSLGPGQYLVLGGTSAHSRDSRDWGPIEQSQIVGRAVWVVWPPGRIRRLTATAPPPGGDG